MQSMKTEGGTNVVIVGIAVLTAGVFLSVESLAQPLFPGAQHAAGNAPESIVIEDLNGD